MFDKEYLGSYCGSIILGNVHRSTARRPQSTYVTCRYAHSHSSTPIVITRVVDLGRLRDGFEYQAGAIVRSRA